MSTDEENYLATEAKLEISTCCQTVADIGPIIEYIKYLEDKIKQLEEGIQNGRT